VAAFAFVNVTAWIWLTRPATMDALRGNPLSRATTIRYILSMALVFLVAALWTPTLRWLSPPWILALMSLFVIPAVACALAPAHHVLFAALANACPIVPFMFEADPSNSHPLGQPDTWVFLGIWFGLAYGASLVYSIPFLLYARKSPSISASSRGERFASGY
jgi:hypothetical protein